MDNFNDFDNARVQKVIELNATVERQIAEINSLKKLVSAWVPSVEMVVEPNNNVTVSLMLNGKAVSVQITNQELRSFNGTTDDLVAIMAQKFTDQLFVDQLAKAISRKISKQLASASTLNTPVL